MTTPPRVTLFTDGACLGNPGPGGWAYILRNGSEEIENSGGELDTTNQRMEVTAVLRALETLEEPTTVSIYADSQYVTKGLTEWMDGGLVKGWKNSSGDYGNFIFYFIIFYFFNYIHSKFPHIFGRGNCD